VKKDSPADECRASFLKKLGGSWGRKKWKTFKQRHLCEKKKSREIQGRINVAWEWEALESLTQL